MSYTLLSEDGAQGFHMDLYLCQLGTVLAFNGPSIKDKATTGCHWLISTGSNPAAARSTATVFVQTWHEDIFKKRTNSCQASVPAAILIRISMMSIWSAHRVAARSRTPQSNQRPLFFHLRCALDIQHCQLLCSKLQGFWSSAGYLHTAYNSILLRGRKRESGIGARANVHHDDPSFSRLL